MIGFESLIFIEDRCAAKANNNKNKKDKMAVRTIEFVGMLIVFDEIKLILQTFQLTIIRGQDSMKKVNCPLKGQ